MPYAEFSDPQSLNLYSYVRNIPTAKVDADGHCPTCIEDVVEVFADHPQAAAVVAEAADAVTDAVVSAAETTISTLGVVGVVVFGSQQTANEQQDTIQGHESSNQQAEPQVSTNGAGKKGGGKDYADTPENDARTAQGKPPIGKDGHPMELHSADQTHKDQLQEMTRTDHRLNGNFKKNHANTGQQRSVVDRKQAAKDRRAHWKKVHEHKTKKE